MTKSCPTTHQMLSVHNDSNPWENLWSSSEKWNNNSTFTKTENRRQHALVTCAERALQMGRLIVAVRVLNVQRPE